MSMLCIPAPLSALRVRPVLSAASPSRATSNPLSTSSNRAAKSVARLDSSSTLASSSATARTGRFSSPCRRSRAACTCCSWVCIELTLASLLVSRSRRRDISSRRSQMLPCACANCFGSTRPASTTSVALSSSAFKRRRSSSTSSMCTSSREVAARPPNASKGPSCKCATSRSSALIRPSSTTETRSSWRPNWERAVVGGTCRSEAFASATASSIPFSACCTRLLSTATSLSKSLRS
mmetsp:Transcript_45162/g.107456  ORF Transcript_45162/g.107456 Transcript_45162/m.107456 type:complete len:237 (-) Transcript_45162:63-773(-)